MTEEKQAQLAAIVRPTHQATPNNQILKNA